MKRILFFLPVLCFLFSGCLIMGDHIKEPVNFYYVRADYQEDLREVLVVEQREASGHLDDLSYLLALYLMGPAEENLISPIPRGTRIYLEEGNTSGIILKLSDTANTMSDSEFSLACACLSLTCMDITGSDKVTVTSENRSVTMTAENLAFYDVSADSDMEETQ